MAHAAVGTATTVAAAGGFAFASVTDHFPHHQCHQSTHDQQNQDRSDVCTEPFHKSHFLWIFAWKLYPNLCTQSIAFLVGSNQHVDHEGYQSECHDGAQNVCIAAEQLTERICEIADIEPPEIIKPAEPEIKPQENKEKENPLRELEDLLEENDNYFDGMPKRFLPRPEKKSFRSWMTITIW